MPKKIIWRPTKWETPRWTITWHGKKCCVVTDNWSGWGPMAYKQFPSIKRAFAHVAKSSKVEPKPLCYASSIGAVELALEKQRDNVWRVGCKTSGAGFSGGIKDLERAKACAESIAQVLLEHKFIPRK